VIIKCLLIEQGLLKGNTCAEFSFTAGMQLNCLLGYNVWSRSLTLRYQFIFLFQLDAVQLMVSSCERALKLVSDILAKKYAFLLR
jgi:hypothetical protein